MILSDVCLSDVCLSVCLSVAYIGPKSRTERPRKTKIDKEVAYVTRDSDTSFKVKRSEVDVTGARAYCGGLPPTACLILYRNVGLVCALKSSVTSKCMQIRSETTKASSKN